MSNPTILHLNAYYIDNHLYSQLYSKLNGYVDQKVYIPIKLNRKPENVIDLENGKLYFDKCIKPSHKYNYFGKINFLFKRLVAEGLQNKVDFVHAHNLFTDGALAYKLYKAYNIPYIVTIRLTDVTLQYKYMYHRRSLANKVLRNAEKIIFISPIYRDRLYAMVPQRLRSQFLAKTKIVPNGMNDIWIKNTYPERNHSKKDVVNLIFVGQIMKLKNIKELIAAVDVLNDKAGSSKYQLTVVGGANHAEPDYYKEFLEIVENHDTVTYLGKVKDVTKLMELYRNADIFTMPSKPELFGLVYIEALSQGLPIIYSKGEGIDGFFEDVPVGASVEPESVESIAAGIEKVANTQYKNLNDIIQPFDWNNLIKEYLKFYHQNEQN